MQPDIRSGKLWVEEGQTREAQLASVALVGPLDRVYTYTVDEEMLERLCVGHRVSVPVGKRNRITPGFVIDIHTGPWSSTLKPIGEILDPGGELSEHLLELGRWISSYYQCPLGRTIAAMTPNAARQLSGFRSVRYVQLASPETNEDAAPKLGGKQRAILDHLADHHEPIPTETLLAETSASRATLRTLIGKGLVVETVRREPPTMESTQEIEEPEFELTKHQSKALKNIDAALASKKFRAQLLYGVSGSGKTEVYVRAMRRVIAEGRQAIMLVPEIALTTQLVQRLLVRFERVVVLHSGLTGAQRGVAWEAIRRGEVDVVIGTRSAVFAPCPSPGLFVVDEEQETSYKNLQAPRFHVRDVAIKRAHTLDVPILLGSATPSLELWHNASRHPDYGRIDLPQRVTDRPLPPVQLVDMRDESAQNDSKNLVLSAMLLRELDATLQRNEQAVLLLNRRGFAQWIQCEKCGMRIKCPQCNVQMVFHQSRGAAVCHHCHHRVSQPTQCPDPTCGGKLIRCGHGTERLEEVLAKLLPDARVCRADSDTMRHSDHYSKLLRGFESQQFDILVGTQMIAKGLDFPNVSLVGVISAEPTGAASDFRAGERLFQLITQVAGRAGRAEVPGRVIVQTLDPQLPALRFATLHNFTGFAEAELKRRAMLKLPPYYRMTRLVVSAKTERITNDQSKQLAQNIRDVAAEHDLAVDLLGPHPCGMERRRSLYRYEILLRSAATKTMTTLLDQARHSKMLRLAGATIMVDVDPVDMS